MNEGTIYKCVGGDREPMRDGEAPWEQQHWRAIATPNPEGIRGRRSYWNPGQTVAVVVVLAIGESHLTGTVASRRGMLTCHVPAGRGPSHKHHALSPPTL